jgi:putative CocE/NonD family hydrolase
LALAAAYGVAACTGLDPDSTLVERDVPAAMRDGIILRADVWRPRNGGPFPVLVYRTPYGKHYAAEAYTTHLRAVERGYAVVIQDVRGRYASDGEFEPYRNEGRDGYDTIEWAARQPWSTGEVGTFGLSYPGAVQWLAAVESPPHLKAMVPAMTFSTPRNFFYSGGVFDASWIPWITNNIAPDLRKRKNLPGPRTDDEAAEQWARIRNGLRTRLLLNNMPELSDVAPFYFEWLRHPPDDPWWDWAEIRGRYDRVDAAVLNLSGWHDEAYGPEGAGTNFNGIMASRSDEPELRARLVIGPWVHGVRSMKRTVTGDLDFGPDAAIDYDALVLRWMDRYLKGVDNGIDREPPVRTFVMSENRWRDRSAWPPPEAKALQLFLAGPSTPGRPGALIAGAPEGDVEPSRIASDPSRPVTDPYGDLGPHDYRNLANHPGVLVFDSEPFADDLEVAGMITADIYLSCDCRDTDLWIKLLDVHPDGSAFNVMSPGLDVQRASYRDPKKGRQLLEPGKVHLLRLDRLTTNNLFRRGHRLRVQVSTSFFPHFSRNLHTGELETESGSPQQAEVRVHHDATFPSGVELLVIRRD